MYQLLTLTQSEQKLAELIWQNSPITSPTLVEIANSKLDWKKSTTYTVLKKLCDKGIFKNDNANILTLVTFDELVESESRNYVENSFGGSLPKFIATFIGGKKLTKEQADEIRTLIDEHESGD